MPLGMEERTISDDQITASSEYSDTAYHGANNARLNRPAQMVGTLSTRGAWCAGVKDLNQWIRVDLMKPTWVTGVMIQGREDYPRWVKEYKVEYSSDGQNWMYVKRNGEQAGMVSLRGHN